MWNAAIAVLVLAPQDAREWVEKLRSDDIEARDEAAHRLRALGASALPALEAVLKDSDVELALRARALWCRLPLGNRREMVRIPDTKVSFELAEIPAAEGRRVDGTRAPLKPFWIGVHEVSWREFLAYYADQERRRKVDGVTRPTPFVDFLEVDVPRDDASPATHLHWYSAAVYCEWLSKTAGGLYRLPTEAEWEAAARGGLEGDTLEPTADFAWTAIEKPRPRGLKEANRYGLRDILGNVREFALEPFRPGGFEPVLRGADGSFSTRETIRPEWHERDPQRPRSLWNLTDAPLVGFRVARVEGTRDVDPGAFAVLIQDMKSPTPEQRRRGHFFTRVRGEVENLGDATIEELELTVLWQDEAGKPILVDEPGRPLFGRTWPVLANSAWSGDVARPLPPKGRRAFVVDVPYSFMEDLPDPPSFVGRVTAIRRAP